MMGIVEILIVGGIGFQTRGRGIGSLLVLQEDVTHFILRPVIVLVLTHLIVEDRIAVM